MKPGTERIKKEVAALRKRIEDDSTDEITKRLAQVAEDALRWATEDTDWQSPAKDIDGMADIIHKDYTSRRSKEESPPSR